MPSDYPVNLYDETQFSHDFSSPQGAILRLEDAMAARDIEGAVAAKDFATAAKLLLADKPAAVRTDPDVLQQATEVLELAYRAEIKQNGFPDLTGLRRRFSRPTPFGPGISTVTEEVRHPDGGVSTQRILVAETHDGWRVVHPVD